MKAVVLIATLCIFAYAQLAPEIKNVSYPLSMFNGGELQYVISIFSTSPPYLLYSSFNVGDLSLGGGGTYRFDPANATNMWNLYYDFTIPPFFRGKASLYNLMISNEGGQDSDWIRNKSFNVDCRTNRTNNFSPVTFLSANRMGNASALINVGQGVNYTLQFSTVAPPYRLSGLLSSSTGVKQIEIMGFEPYFSCNTPNSTCDDGQVYTWTVIINVFFTNWDEAGVYQWNQLNLMNQAMVNQKAILSQFSSLSSIAFIGPPRTVTITAATMSITPEVRDGGPVNISLDVRTTVSSSKVNTLMYVVTAPNGRIIYGGGGIANFQQVSPGRWTLQNLLVVISQWAPSGTYNVSNVLVGSGGVYAKYNFPVATFRVLNVLTSPPILSVAVSGSSPSKRSTPVLSIIFSVRSESPVIWLNTEVSGPGVSLNYSEPTLFLSISNQAYTYIMHIDLPDLVTGNYTISNSYVDAENMQFSNVYPNVAVEYIDGYLVTSNTSDAGLVLPIMSLLFVMTMMQ